MRDVIDEEKVKRYYELKQEIKSLELEAEKINLEIKDIMRRKNISEISIGDYLLEIKLQDRSKFNNTIVNYLKENGYEDLIIETYDPERFKELNKLGKLDKQELDKYKIEKTIYALYIKHIKK